MIFYVALDTEGKHHLLTTQALAAEVNKTFEKVDVPTTEKVALQGFVQGLLDQIDALTGQVNSLKHDASIAPVTITKVEPREPSYTEQSVFTDELWEQLPLARKFHFAASAMEAGRDILAGLASK